MKTLFISIIFFCLIPFQNNFHEGNWKVIDIFPVIEKVNLKDMALRKLVKERIEKEKVEIIIANDSIKMRKNGMSVDSFSISDLKINNKKDSATFIFDNKKAIFNLREDKNHAILLINNETYFLLEK